MQELPRLERDLRCVMLEETLHREVPLSGQMGVAVERYDGRTLLLSADFERNINIHGTAFGGSLFSVCALCGWGLLHLQTEGWERPPHLVVAEGQIRYLKPVKHHIEVYCTLPPDFDSFVEMLQERGRARVALKALVQAGGEPAVEFTGVYAGLLSRPR